MNTQGTAEWFQSRVGKATASRAKDVLARLKSGAAAQARQDYLLEIVTERMTGSALSHFTTTAMQWGTDQETAARIEYAWQRGIEVAEIGFVDHPTIAGFGCSPDGLVGDDGLVEFKCPFNSVVHLRTVLGGVIPDEHIPQVQSQLAVTGRAWADFCSFDPRMPAGLQLFVVRVPRDDIYIANLETQVRDFLNQADALEQQLRGIQSAHKEAA